MDNTVSFDVVMSNLFIYLTISFVAIFLLNRYAKVKFKDRPAAYNILRLTRQLAFVICLLATLLVVGSSFVGFEYTEKSLSYLSVPYFMAVVFFAINVFRRIKAERERRL